MDSSVRNPNINMPPERPSISDEANRTGEIAADLGTVANNVGESAEAIDRHAHTIRNSTVPENLPIISPSLDGISSETQELIIAQAEIIRLQGQTNDLQTDLTAEQNKVENWTKYASDAESKNIKLIEENRQLRDKNAQQFKQMLAWIGVVSVAGIGVCLALALWTKSKVAIAVAVGFGLTLATSIAVTMFMKEIAFVTIIVLGVAFLGVIGYVGWQFFTARKTEEELVHTGELAKQYLPTEAREKLFGHGAEPGTVDAIQGTITKQRVKKIREHSKKQATPSVPATYKPIV